LVRVDWRRFWMLFFDVQTKRDSRSKMFFTGCARKWFFAEIGCGYSLHSFVRAASSTFVTFFYFRESAAARITARFCRALRFKKPNVVEFVARDAAHAD